ncbi:MAG: hypothetical protein E3J21_01965 [Anaerolineales bacterium]|nr:MAG: hypothetical protein E3J21_01965 [Anaerolineales bacterium]
MMPPVNEPLNSFRLSLTLSRTFHALDTRRLLIAILFMAIFTMAVRVPTDTDTWWHLRSGEYILRTHSIPRHDVFSHTMTGKSWIDHGWLAQIAIYLLYTAFGYAGLGLALAAVVTLAFVFVFLQSEENLYLRAFIAVLAAITSAVVWIVRPQIVSFLLTAVFSYILYLYKRKGRNYLFLIPLLIVLWVNVHGAFITGFILLGCYVIGEVLNNLLGHTDDRVLSFGEIASLIKVSLIALVVLVINPNTYQMYLYPFKTVGIGALRDYIQEWASPDFHQFHLHPFVWMVLLILAAVGLSRRRIDFTDLVLTSFFCYMALWAGRNIALFALVAAPVLMRYGAEAIRTLWEAIRAYDVEQGILSQLGRKQIAPGPWLTGLNWLILILLLSLCALKVYQPLRSEVNLAAQEKYLPVEAVRFIRANNLPGPMFNSYNWGGYLIWHLYPDYPVFIDGRTDLYDDEFIREYVKVTLARPGWREVLDRYEVNFILIESDSILAAFLAEGDEWQSVHADTIANVFLRNTPRNRDLLSKLLGSRQ